MMCHKYYAFFRKIKKKFFFQRLLKQRDVIPDVLRYLQKYFEKTVAEGQQLLIFEDFAGKNNE